MKKVKVQVVTEGIVANHVANRLEGKIGPVRDRKDLAQLVIQEDNEPEIEILEIKDA